MLRSRRTRRRSKLDYGCGRALESHCAPTKSGATVCTGVGTRCVPHPNRAKCSNRPQPHRLPLASQRALAVRHPLPWHPRVCNRARKAIPHVLLRRLPFWPVQVRSRSGQHSTTTSPAAGEAGGSAPGAVLTGLLSRSGWQEAVLVRNSLRPVLFHRGRLWRSTPDRDPPTAA